MRITILGPTEPQVLLDSTDAPPGQRAPAVAQLARGLVDQGVGVTVVTLCSTVTRPWMGSSGLLTVRVVPSRSRARDLALTAWRPERAALVRQIQESRPDLVHAHWTYEFAMAAQDSGLLCVITIRDAPGTIFRHFKDPYRAVRWALACVVAGRGGEFVANSPYTAAAFRGQTGYRKPVTVIPNGLTDPILLSIEPPRHSELSKSLVVADGSRRKNVHAALQAQRLLEQRGVTAEMTVIGDGLGADFLERISPAQRPRNVRMLGRQPRDVVRREIEHCNMVVHPALEESFGNVLLEGMAAARPVIAGRNSGAVPWVLGTVGLLVDVRRPLQIAEAMESLRVHPRRASVAGLSGRKRVMDLFASDQAPERYLALYQRLVTSTG